VAAAVAIGLTVTVTVIGKPAHPEGDVGVTVYVAVPAVLPVVVKI
jgi:hypothetical protein